MRITRILCVVACLLVLTGCRGSGGAARLLDASAAHVSVSRALPDGGPANWHDPTTTSTIGHPAPPAAARSAAARRRVGPPPADTASAAPVYAEIDGMPRTLRRIGGCESSGSPTAPINWTAQNRHSTASGGFQILDTTWKGWAFSYGQDVGAPQYAKARYAPPDVQLHVALGAFLRQGTGPWSESRSCWA